MNRDDRPHAPSAVSGPRNGTLPFPSLYGAEVEIWQNAGPAKHGQQDAVSGRLAVSSLSFVVVIPILECRFTDFNKTIPTLGAKVRLGPNVGDSVKEKMNTPSSSTGRFGILRNTAAAAFLLAVLFFNSAFSLRVQIVEVFSGNTFKTSDGAVVRAIAWDSDGGAHELLCNEPLATSVARRKLIGQSILMWQRGLDPSGTELVSIQVNGIDYETLLNEAGACRRAETPLAFTVPDAPRLVSRNIEPAMGATSQQQAGTQADSAARYKASPDGQLPEVYWQHAFNELYADGATEVAVEAGRADIVNGTYAIEVDRIQKWHEAIGQALHYAKETGKQPAIALFDDGSANSAEAYAEAQKVCASEGIKVWKINDYVRPGYMVRNTGATASTVPASWLKPSTTSAKPGLYVGPRNGIYYLNSSGNKEYITDRYAK